MRMEFRRSDFDSEDFEWEIKDLEGSSEVLDVVRESISFYV